MGFEVAGIIMDERIGLDLFQFPGRLHHLHFIRETFIDNALFGGEVYLYLSPRPNGHLRSESTRPENALRRIPIVFFEV